MFFFGLFSTHIPYIILMGLYFIGFGLYSTNAIKEKLSANESSEKTIQLKEVGKIQEFPSKTFHYHNYDFATKAEKETSLVELQTQRIVFADFEEDCHIGLFRFFFSRPPPVC